MISEDSFSNIKQKIVPITNLITYCFSAFLGAMVLWNLFTFRLFAFGETDNPNDLRTIIIIIFIASIIGCFVRNRYYSADFFSISNSSFKRASEREKFDGAFCFSRYLNNRNPRRKAVFSFDFYMFSGLLIYLGSFFSEILFIVWKESLSKFSLFTGFIACSLLSSTVSMTLVMFLSVFPVSGFFRFGRKRMGESRSPFVRYSFYLALFIIIVCAWIFSVAFFGGSGFETFLKISFSGERLASPYVGELIMFLIGFVPLHWAYTLFVVPIKVWKLKGIAGEG